MLQFSLVLATYGRSDVLAPMLASLLAQTCRDYELIVVDQNPDDRVVPLLEPVRAAGVPVRHLRAPSPNLSAARNQGIEAARGQWIAFPDDDCWYETDCLERVVEAARADGATDGWIARWVEAVPEAEAMRHAHQPLSAEAFRSFRGGDASSISLFLRLDVVRRVGAFDSRIGVGRYYGAGEETDLMIRVLDAGATVRPLPSARVHHRHDASPPALTSATWRSVRQRQRGAGALYAKHRMKTSVILRGLAAPLIKGVLSGQPISGLVLGTASVAGRIEGMRRWRREPPAVDGQGIARIGTSTASSTTPAPASDPPTTAAVARISVIMPLYDKAPFVEQAIRSALDNGPGVIEVIVVDDGSRDDGPAIVGRIDDPRVRLIRKANGGVSSARNVGLAQATGDWLAFLDADDYWLPGYIDAVQAMIARFPASGMVTTRYVLEDDEGRHSQVPGDWNFGDLRDPFVVDDFYRLMSLGHYCYMCSVVIRRDVIERAKLRFPLGEQLGEDLEVIFRASEGGPVAADPRTLVVYRDGNHGARLSRVRVDTRPLPFFRRLDERLASAGFPSHLRPGAINYLRSYYSSLVSHAVQTGHRREGLALIRHRVIAAHPPSLLKALVMYTLPPSMLARVRERRGSKA